MITIIRMLKPTFILISLILLFINCSKGQTSNQGSLSKSEINEGWGLLFDGKSFDGWNMAKENGWKIEENALSLADGGNIWTIKRYKNFILSCEFKMSSQCNSGIFIRTDNTEDYVQTGIEIQIIDCFGKTETDKHDCGAIYDCLAPSNNAVKPAGEWNNIIITCNDNVIKVTLNDVHIIDMNLDEWAEPNKNPDGSENKFKTALKDFSREGYIGFQDHGHPVWYRNVKIKEL